MAEKDSILNQTLRRQYKNKIGIMQEIATFPSRRNEPEHEMDIDFGRTAFASLCIAREDKYNPG
jgi:hypothetical protein